MKRHHLSQHLAWSHGMDFDDAREASRAILLHHVADRPAPDSPDPAASDDGSPFGAPREPLDDEVVDDLEDALEDEHDQGDASADEEERERERGDDEGDGRTLLDRGFDALFGD